MTYYLDSNVLIYFLKGKSENIRKILRSQSPQNIKLPSVVKAELLTGAYKSQNITKTLEALEETISPYEIIPFDNAASEVYGKMRADLETSGNIIGANDLMIAATVLSRGGILVTNNIKEFERVKGLQTENWSD
jgi:Predicted nucleic acid-binding protein, contains PIN domain